MPDSDAELAEQEKKPRRPHDLRLARHRGARFVDGCGSCRRGNLICPWHSFAYNLDLTPRSFEMLGAMPLKGTLT